MEIKVNNNEELIRILNQTTDRTAFIITFDETEVKDETRRTEQLRS